MLDLCAGLGGASEAFLRAGWDVVRIDINDALEDVPGMQIMDILELQEPFLLNGGAGFDFIWGSPDCTDFSLAYNAKGPRAIRAGEDFTPDTRVVEKMKEIIDYYDPQYWVIENVRGASRIFSRLLGQPPRQILGPYFLWGLFPFLDMGPDWVPERKMNIGPGPLRYNKRSKIPLEISMRLLHAVQGQTRITDWCE